MQMISNRNMCVSHRPLRLSGGFANGLAFGKGLRLLLALACLGLAGKGFAQAPAYNGNIKKIVLFDYSVPNGHPTSRQFIRDCYTRLQKLYGFNLVMLGQQQQAQLTATVLQGAQILVFSDGDGDVLPPGDQRTAVEDFVQNQGKSVLMIHAAAAYVNNWQFLKDAAVQQYWTHAPDGTQGTVYTDTMGLNRAETKNIMKGIAARQTFKDEWYSFHASARLTPGVIVLLSADEKSFTPSDAMPDHPEAWTHHMGKGLAMYESMGHADVWTGNGATPNGGSMQAMLWNMNRYLGHDFAGCMDSTYAEYNPDASVAKLNASDANPCVTLKNPVSNVRLDIRSVPNAAAPRIQRGGLSFILPVTGNGRYTVRLLNTRGREVYAAQATGPSQLEVPVAKLGIYYAEITPVGSGSKSGSSLKPEVRKIDLIH